MEQFEMENVSLLEPANTWKLGRKLCNCTMYHLAGTKKLKLLRADWHSSCYNKGAEAMTQMALHIMRHTRPTKLHYAPTTQK